MRRTQKKVKRTATEAERKFISELGGSRTFNSGTGLEKGDGRVMNTYQVVDGALAEASTGFRVENKTTVHEYYRLTAQSWADLRRAAISAGEEPVFHIQLRVGSADRTDLVVITANFFGVLFGLEPREDYATTNAKGYQISRRRWREASSLVPRPHLRIALEAPQGKPFDLVVLSKATFMERARNR